MNSGCPQDIGIENIDIDISKKIDIVMLWIPR